MSGIENKSKIGGDVSSKILLIRGWYLPVIDCRPTIYSRVERFDYRVESPQYNTNLLDESLNVRSPRADYNSSDSNDLDSSLSPISDDIIESTVLVKTLQLLNFLAGEDVTLYEADDILSISVHTANKYVAKIKSKFGVLTLPAAVLYAAKEGLISKSSDKIL